MNLKELRSLEVGLIQLSDAAFIIDLVEHLAALPLLETLTLRGSLETRTVNSFAPYLPRICNLRTLRLGLVTLDSLEFIQDCLLGNPYTVSLEPLER